MAASYFLYFSTVLAEIGITEVMVPCCALTWESGTIANSINSEVNPSRSVLCILGFSCVGILGQSFTIYLPVNKVNCVSFLRNFTMICEAFNISFHTAL